MSVFLQNLFWNISSLSGISFLYRVFFMNNKLAVLGYHSVSHGSNAAETHNELYKHLSVSTDMFEKQMRWLQRHGYVFLRFSDLLEIREGKRIMPHRPALVYFDDGYKDNYLNAYPVLKRLGIPATIFVVTDCLDKKKILWETVLNPENANIFLSWKELCEIRDVFDIGTHTITHRKLTSLEPEEVREELVRSRAYIEKQTGARVIAVSYPKSRFTQEIQKIAADCGFEFILSHGRGFRHSVDLRYLEKIPIGPEDSLRTFVLKLGAYYPLYNAIRWISRS